MKIPTDLRDIPVARTKRERRAILVQILASNPVDMVRAGFGTQTFGELAKRLIP